MYYDVYILNCLMKQPCYGYEIKKKLVDSFGFCTHVSNNTLYPILKKYLHNGITEQRTEHIPGKPDRIIYSITDKGRKYFIKELRNFSENKLMDRQHFLIRVYYFQFLDRATRERLLRLRKQAVIQGLSTLAAKKPTIDPIFEPDAPAIDKHTKGMLELDLEIISYYEARLDMPCILSEEGFVLSN